MKKLLLSTALGVVMATASVADVSPRAQMNAEVLRNDMILSSQSAQQSSSAAIWVVALMAVLVLVTAAASGGGGVHHYFHDSIAYSDQSLKTDIRKIGVSASGIGIYEFRYKGHPQVFQGAIAQDVARHVPGAVARGADGFLTVDYSKIDVQMRWLH